MRAFNVKGAVAVALLLIGLLATNALADGFWGEPGLDLPSSLAQAEQGDKEGVFVFFEMEDCPFCAQMERDIFTDFEVQQLMQIHFELMKVDIESTEPMLSADGRQISQKAFAESQRVRATPVMIFYNPQGEELTRYVGPTRTVAGFLELVDFVSSGAATQPGMNFRRFQQQNRD